MRLNSVIILSLLGVANASPVPADSSSVVDAEFKFDRDLLEADYKVALEKVEADSHFTKRLNTHSANNVGYGKAIAAAAEATYKQVKAISNWNRARQEFVKGVTQIMMDHNPDPKTAVAAICYNKGYAIKDPKNIYGLRSEDLSIWPAKTDYDCFYMGRGNAFWSQGDGGSVNLWTRWQRGVCRFDDKSDLYC